MYNIYIFYVCMYVFIYLFVYVFKRYIHIYCTAFHAKALIFEHARVFNRVLGLYTFQQLIIGTFQPAIVTGLCLHS